MNLKPARVLVGEGIRLEDGRLAVIRGVRWFCTKSGEAATCVLITETKEKPEEPVELYLMDVQIDITEDGTRELLIPGATVSEEALDYIQGKLVASRQELREAIEKGESQAHSAIVDTKQRAKDRTAAKKKVITDAKAKRIQEIMVAHECDEKEAKKILKVEEKK